MSKFPGFKLDRVIEKAIEDAMEGYDYLWRYDVKVTTVGITDHGVDVWLGIHFSIDYDVALPVEEEELAELNAVLDERSEAHE